MTRDAGFFWLATVVLLALMWALQVTSAANESQTYDESGHLLSGYVYLKTGDYRLDPAHPPLGRVLAALPLLLLEVGFPGPYPVGDIDAVLLYGRRFLYENRVPADTMLFYSRCSIIALTLLLGLILALWTRARFGAPVAVLALFLFALDPNFLAHGRYVTTDLVAALFIFLSVITWTRYLETGRWRDLLVAGVVLGLALSSKFSAAFLLPLDAVLGLFRWRRLSIARLAVSSIVLAGLGLLVLALVYAPATLHHGGQHPLFAGLDMVSAHAKRGHSAYLLGKISTHGWWYYFPVAFAVKTPSAVLLLLVLLLAGVRRIEMRFVWLMLALAPVSYFLLSLTSPLNLGLRYILPIYPFLFVLLAAGLFHCWRGTRVFRWALVLVVGLEIFEATWIYPHHLAFFNLPSGGPANGPRYLLDSNLDWGQDLKNLQSYVLAYDLPNLCLAYFGLADPGYYGIVARPVPRTWEVERAGPPDCIAAVSVTPLYDLYIEPGSFQWLRRRKPFERIGYSIYLYDLRPQP